MLDGSLEGQFSVSPVIEPLGDCLLVLVDALGFGLVAREQTLFPVGGKISLAKMVDGFRESSDTSYLPC